MQDIEKDYREWVNANKKMRYEIEDLKDASAGGGKRAGIYEVRFFSLVGFYFFSLYGGGHKYASNKNRYISNNNTSITVLIIQNLRTPFCSS